MVADTSTPILGLLLQGTGNNNNSWGVNLNNSVIQPLENAVAGANNITLTGGAYTLTQANGAYSTLVLIGTLTSNVTITVPSLNHAWHILNAVVSGGFVVLIKTAAGAAVNVPFGKTIQIYCDSVSMYRGDRDTVGEYFFHAGLAVPGSAIECNGAAISRTGFPDLFAQIGTTHGNGNGTTTFNVPDGTTAGKFLRSRTGSVTAGTAQTNQNKAHTHPGAAVSGTTGTDSPDHTHNVIGTTIGMSANANHTHGYIKPNTTGNTGGGGAFGNTPVAATSDVTNIDHTHSMAFVSGGINSNHAHAFSATTGTIPADAGGTEARPENISGILCVRY